MGGMEGTVADPENSERGGPRNMKYKPLRLVAIFLAHLIHQSDVLMLSKVQNIEQMRRPPDPSIEGTPHLYSSNLRLAKTDHMGGGPLN